MGRDIWYNLGETISKTAKDIGEKADIFIEAQKLQSRAGSEKRMVEKCLRDLGNIVYRRFVDGEIMDEELEAVCQEITRRQTVITGYKEEYARLKGRKICPGCGESIDRSAAYCPKCGAVCWEDEEPEETETEQAESPEEMQAEPAAGEDITAQAEDSEADEGSKETEKLQFAEEVPLEEEHLSPVQEAGEQPETEDTHTGIQSVSECLCEEEEKK